MYRKTAPRDSEEVDYYLALSCSNLLCPHSSVELVQRLSVPMSVMIFGNKFEEKSLLQEECYVVGEIIKILLHKRDGLCTLGWSTSTERPESGTIPGRADH